MDKRTQAEAKTKILVRDKYLLAMWDSGSQRICGKRVALGLFSVESFSSNKKPEHQVARLLAERIVPFLRDEIMQNEKVLRDNLKEVEKDLQDLQQDPLYASIELAEAPTQTYEITVEQRGAWPLVNLFVRSFVLVDMITSTLKRIHSLGAIDFSTYKRREKKLAKPMWQTMTRLEEAIKGYHLQRKAISNIKETE
ncbi:hypothetical protein [Stutzerimonas kunmingensis]|uniref:hypothetical protein n=1 Tax=Stutzerimonas kunmingensis TaxID=1211807 RepID=UPI0028B01D32|nr:hypothetical protein [Stutzerimonas kunmingensis]